MAKSMKPGGGGRFEKLSRKMYGEGMSKDEADAAAAAAGKKRAAK